MPLIIQAILLTGVLFMLTMNLIWLVAFGFCAAWAWGTFLFGVISDLTQPPRL